MTERSAELPGLNVPSPPGDVSSRAAFYNSYILIYQKSDPIVIPENTMKGFQFALGYLGLRGFDNKYDITSDIIAGDYLECQKRAVLRDAQQLVDDNPRFRGRTELQRNIDKARKTPTPTFSVEQYY